MLRNKKLEVDPDKEAFYPLDCLSQLDETP